MGAEEKNKTEFLSRIVADLFASPKGGEELSARIRRLREEIKKVIENEDTIFGKFHGVAESFREFIPEEIQRYNAAIKALLKTSKISRQEVVKAVNAQLEELKILEKVLLGAASGWRYQLKDRVAKSREIGDRLSKLREQIGRLESEEKEILNSIAAREKEMDPVEKAVRELFADIRAEISHIKKRVEEPATGERPVFQPVPPWDSLNAGPAGTTGGGLKSEIREAPAPQDTESRKKCPMCGGRMDLQIGGKTWLCYSCAYEESGTGGVQPESEVRVSPGPQDTGSQKKCPMCGGRMDLQIDGGMWLCYSCAHEEPGKGGVPPSRPSPPSVPSASASSNEREEPIKGSIGGSLQSNKEPSAKKQPCPACTGKMRWHDDNKVWQCPHCGYERRI
jgi:ribosomal protein L37AE/L43A